MQAHPTARRSFFGANPAARASRPHRRVAVRSLALARILAAFEELVASSALAVEVRDRVNCMSNFQLAYPAAYVR